jgi:hypothetical protein
MRIEPLATSHDSMVRSHRFSLTAAALSLAVVAVSSACAGAPASPAADTTSAPTMQPASTAILDADIAEATEIREQYGLRADEAWVRAVADDPAALVPEQYGIPLMPDELADLMSRRWPNSLIGQLRAYGQEFPDDFATAYINQKASGVVVEFKANLGRHRAALAALPLDGPLEVRQATWSLRELEGFLEEVRAEQAWIESTGARWVDTVLYELENAVVIRYEGPRGLENLIEGHFGNPTWLQARWEGPGL